MQFSMTLDRNQDNYESLLQLHPAPDRCSLILQRSQVCRRDDSFLRHIPNKPFFLAASLLPLITIPMSRVALENKLANFPVILQRHSPAVIARYRLCR